jgi:hypothetical protein
MKINFLPGIGHRSRAIFFMMGLLVFYCLWLWLLLALGLVGNETSPRFAALLLLLPLLPVAGVDLWMRITWRQEIVTLYPPPPTRLARLLGKEYGLYWFPVLICIPLWIWSVVLLGFLVIY